MKVIGLKDTSLDACVSEAQHEKILITRNGKPVALVVGVEGLDAEQLDLGSDSAFWKLITQRRRQRRITRAQLEEKISRLTKGRAKAAQQNLAPNAHSGTPKPVRSVRKKPSRRRG